MLEQEFYIQTHTGSDGIAHIDISTGIADQDIEVMVSYSALENNQEEAERERILANAKPAMDMSKFCGVIKLSEDPVEY